VTVTEDAMKFPIYIAKENEYSDNSDWTLSFKTTETGLETGFSNDLQFIFGWLCIFCIH
jgi:hypothetical protein